MANTITDYVYQEIHQGKKDKQILDSVVDRGYSREYAENLLARCKTFYPEWQKKQIEASEEARYLAWIEGKFNRMEERDNWWKTTGGGIGICVSSVGFVIGILGISIALDSWLGWGIMDSGWPLYISLFAIVPFLGGVYSVLKGIYHGVRWW